MSQEKQALSGEKSREEFKIRSEQYMPMYLLGVVWMFLTVIVWGNKSLTLTMQVHHLLNFKKQNCRTLILTFFFFLLRFEENVFCVARAQAGCNSRCGFHIDVNQHASAEGSANYCSSRQQGFWFSHLVEDLIEPCHEPEVKKIILKRFGESTCMVFIWFSCGAGH